MSILLISFATYYVVYATLILLLLWWSFTLFSTLLRHCVKRFLKYFNFFFVKMKNSQNFNWKFSGKIKQSQRKIMMVTQNINKMFCMQHTTCGIIVSPNVWENVAFYICDKQKVNWCWWFCLVCKCVCVCVMLPLVLQSHKVEINVYMRQATKC